MSAESTAASAWPYCIAYVLLIELAAQLFVHPLLMPPGELLANPCNRRNWPAYAANADQKPAGVKRLVIISNSQGGPGRVERELAVNSKIPAYAYYLQRNLDQQANQRWQVVNWPIVRANGYELALLATQLDAASADLALIVAPEPQAVNVALFGFVFEDFR